MKIIIFNNLVKRGRNNPFYLQEPPTSGLGMVGFRISPKGWGGGGGVGGGPWGEILHPTMPRPQGGIAQPGMPREDFYFLGEVWSQYVYVYLSIPSGLD